MSLLARYYHRRYIRKTLEDRERNIKNSVDNSNDNMITKRSLLSSGETYESATSGFFASAGEVVDTKNQNNNNNDFFLY